MANDEATHAEFSPSPSSPGGGSAYNSPEGPDDEGPTPKRAGRRKINIEFIDDKSRRHITFSKRKAGIMKKAYELSTLTGTQVLLLVASETGHVYTFATTKLQPLITKPEGKNLIQACLNATDTLQAVQPPTSHSGQMQMSPQMYDNSQVNLLMPQSGYGHNSGPIGGHMYAQAQEDEKLLPYASPGHSIQRPEYQDNKPFASGNSHQDMAPSYNEVPKFGASYPHQGGSMPLPVGMTMGGLRGPYPGGPVLPTLSERGNFGGLPLNGPSSMGGYNQFHPSMPSFSPMSGGGGPSPFANHSFPPANNQMFSNGPSLPSLPRHDGSQ
jgi:hypothetical protein